MATTRDYYEILNVEREASDDEIKRAYRKLAIKNGDFYLFFSHRISLVISTN